jgi:hypothetical protein
MPARSGAKRPRKPSLRQTLIRDLREKKRDLTVRLRQVNKDLRSLGIGKKKKKGSKGKSKSKKRRTEETEEDI